MGVMELEREDFSLDSAGVEEVGLLPLKERVFWAPLEAGPLESRLRRVGGMVRDRFLVSILFVVRCCDFVV